MITSYSLNQLTSVELTNEVLGVYLYRFNEEPTEEGYKYLEYKTTKTNLQEIKTDVYDYYNKQCDEEILSGLSYEGSVVWLSFENQFNYKSAWDVALNKGGMNLPVTFKFGDSTNPVYKVFTTIEELDIFMLTVMSHIQNTLTKYWSIKDSINWEDYEIQ